MDLGPIGFMDMAVDSAHGHVLLSGRATGVVVVLDYSGNIVTTVANMPGADAMDISGSTLFVVENSAGAIGRIDLASLTKEPDLATGLVDPQGLALTGGKLWTTTGNLWQQLAGIDLGTGAWSTPSTNTYYRPEIVASPAVANTLWVAPIGISTGGVYRVDTSTGVPLNAVSPPAQASVAAPIAVSPDGTRVVATTVDPSSFPELNAMTLQPDGVVYPGAAFPSAIAFSPDGTAIATGLDNGYDTPDLEVHNVAQAASPTYTANFLNSGHQTCIFYRGLAFDETHHRLFVAMESDVYQTDATFRVITI